MDTVVPSLSLNIIGTVFTCIFTFINIIRACYSMHMSRHYELENVVRDAVQCVWENFVREKKQKNIWNNLAKIKATTMAVEFVEQRISLTCLCNRARLRRLIIEQVEVRKYGRTFKSSLSIPLTQRKNELEREII